MGRAPSLLSMVSVTSARPSGGREVVPAKTTSSILPPRSDLAPCSPMTQESASRTLDLPEPFGPTTQVMPGSKRSVVAEAKDLKPFNVRLFRCMRLGPPGDPFGRGYLGLLVNSGRSVPVRLATRASPGPSITHASELPRVSARENRADRPWRPTTVPRPNSPDQELCRS